MKKNQQLYVNPIYDCDYGDHIGYEIAHADGLTEVIIYGGKKNMRTLEEAKADAEAECRRMNAERWGSGQFVHYPLTAEEKHRFMTEAFGIPDETDGKEQQ